MEKPNTITPNTIKPNRNPGGRPPKYPWRTVEVGQSFYISGIKIRNVRNYARKRYKPLCFKCKEMDIKGIALVRVTRIS